MSVYPCSSCGQRQKGRLATTYNAWFLESGDRECWRQRLCVSCVTLLAASLLGSVSENSSDVTACPACGKDSSQSLSPIYLVVYLPKQEPREYALTTCDSCATTWRESLSAGAKKMADREGAEVGAPTSASAAWAGVLP